MTADDLYRKLGRMDPKARQATPITVQVGNAPPAEVLRSRQVPYQGHPALRLEAVPAVVIADDQPRVQVKYLKPGSPDRRTANWVTLMTEAGKDLFPLAEAERLAADYLARGMTEHSRTWDPVECAVLKDYQTPPPRPPAPPRRAREGRRPALSGVRGGEVASPALLEGTGFAPTVILASLSDRSEAVREREADRVETTPGTYTVAEALYQANQAELRQWKETLAERHPSKSGNFWLDVHRASGAIDDRRREYKTLGGVIKALEATLGPEPDYTGDPLVRAWVWEGIGRRARVLLCVYRADEGIAIDGEREYNLGLRGR